MCPKHLKALVAKGEVLKEMENNKDAIVYFDKVLKIDPKNIKSLFSKGKALQSL